MKPQDEEPIPEPPYKPKGWTTSGWLHHLRRIAETCQDHNPRQARIYRRWAEIIESRDLDSAS